MVCPTSHVFRTGLVWDGCSARHTDGSALRYLFCLYVRVYVCTYLSESPSSTVRMEGLCNEWRCCSLLSFCHCCSLLPFCHCCHFVTTVHCCHFVTAAILSLLFTAVIIHVTNLELCIKVTMCSTVHTGTFSSHQNSIPATSPSSTQPSHLPLIPSLFSPLSPSPSLSHTLQTKPSTVEQLKDKKQKISIFAETLVQRGAFISHLRHACVQTVVVGRPWWNARC